MAVVTMFTARRAIAVATSRTPYLTTSARRERFARKSIRWSNARRYPTHFQTATIVPTRLPPVRQPVPLRRVSAERGRHAFEQLFPGMSLYLVGSGTEALALAIQACMARAPVQPTEAEVIVPAYGCPDLVAACVFAGATARLVDVDPVHWGYDRAQLERSVSPRTVAILAVNLLGLGDEAAGLQQFAGPRGIAVIADSAQHVPIDLPWPPGVEYTVLSFGRGKPMNSLRGGLLVAARPVPMSIASTGRSGIKELVMSSRLAAIAFNLATHPRVYGLTAKLPGLGVGSTRYHALRSIHALPDSAWRQIGAALAQYQAQPEDSLRVWRARFDEWAAHGVTVLRTASKQTGGRHLRLPLLAQDRAHRDELIRLLDAQGCGATRFYAAPLHRIDSLPVQISSQGPFPNASRLADRLLTLPTHDYVTESVADRVSAVIRAAQRTNPPADVDICKKQIANPHA